MLRDAVRPARWWQRWHGAKGTEERVGKDKQVLFIELDDHGIQGIQEEEKSFQMQGNLGST